MVVLFGRVVWCMGDFLKSYLPDVVAEAKLLKELEEQLRANALNRIRYLHVLQVLFT